MCDNECVMSRCNSSWDGIGLPGELCDCKHLETCVKVAIKMHSIIIIILLLIPDGEHPPLEIVCKIIMTLQYLTHISLCMNTKITVYILEVSSYQS